MNRVFWTGRLKVETVTVAIADLPPTLQGTRLVQLSDFHYDGVGISERLLNAAIEASNQANPDLVLLTGDFVTGSPAPIRKLALQLQRLRSQAGIYAVLGNHDLHRPHSKTEVTAALTQAGIQVLWNQIAYPFGPILPLVGLADFWSREFNPEFVMSQLEATVPRIVLAHNPDSAAQLQQWRVDLQLSGHTHGGQIVLPALGRPVSWLGTIRRHTPKFIQNWVPFLRTGCYRVVRHWEWAQGLHQVGQNYLYVNRGLGTYPPGRLFCRPEVTIIQLLRQQVRSRNAREYQPGARHERGLVA